MIAIICLEYMNFYGEQIEKQVLCEAFFATCEKRKTTVMYGSASELRATLEYEYLLLGTL